MLNFLRNLLFLPLRVAVFVVGFTSYWMEVGADFLVGASRSTEYVRKGSCNRCGRCCELLALEMPKFMAKRDWLIRLENIWHDALLNFEPEGVYKNFLVYRCRYFKRKREGEMGFCSIYPFRHRLCRYYPKQIFHTRFALSADCGFYFVKKEVVNRIKDRKAKGFVTFDEVLKEKTDGSARVKIP
ncbi:MAG: hypothetical protein ABH871_08135 [Pseudomonadota bacterium]